MVRDNFKLVDSSVVAGVQVADLLAFGLRRAMRFNFDSPERVATLLGANLLEELKDGPPVRMVALASDRDRQVSDRTAMLLQAMTQLNKPYVAGA
jgi:hypothetical protein